ncbi:hypothetical protein LCGC14_2473190, partial [marine sediment metagenome]
ALDVSYLRAVEAEDVAERIRLASQRQGLRDLPQNFDLSSADTPNELSALWPVELPARAQQSG